MAVSANRLELLQIADAVAREKVIDRQIVLEAMADAIAKAARSRYGAETDVHAEIHPKTGELRLSRHLLVVDPADKLCTAVPDAVEMHGGLVPKHGFREVSYLPWAQQVRGYDGARGQAT